MSYSFKVIASDSSSRARAGVLETSHGSVNTPAFFPVATRGCIKGVTARDLLEIGTPGLLVNAYHLSLRPGAEVIRHAGGLHSFMGWQRPVVSDSGGFQIYSLSSLRKVTDAGVVFRSYWDGARHLVTPESLVQIQEKLGSDVMMVLDQCVSYPAPREAIEDALDRTLLWAERSIRTRKSGDQALFGILQGGMFEDLREEGARRLTQLPLDGFAVGGVGVGESPSLQRKIASVSASLLPEDRPRYLMGVGKPLDLLYGVRAGYDLFDCVLPTRNARNGTLFTSSGKLSIKQTRFKDDPRPIDPECPCYCCRNFSRAYLRHLFLAKEMLSGTLNTLHNLSFYLRFMEQVRDAVAEARVDEVIARWKESEMREPEEGDG